VTCRKKKEIKLFDASFAYGEKRALTMALMYKKKYSMMPALPMV
jgi:hypothetical protein